MSLLAGRKVLLGVSGGIAAYRACELVRALGREGAEVRVVMTRGATGLVTPMTLEALSGHRVVTDHRAAEDPFMDRESQGFVHIDLPRWADLVVVAPATASLVAKAAHGLADDLLSTILLATSAPVLLCPSMNVEMYRKSPVQANLARVREAGMYVLDPEEGELACGELGPGRLPAVEAIVEEVVHRIRGDSALKGRRVLVTAGPTRERLDEVRFLSNRSSGRMGFALARAAVRRGAEVVLISGPSAERPPLHTECHVVESAAEMREAVLSALSGTALLLMAAAVADARPMGPVRGKRPKEDLGSALPIEPTEEILAEAVARAEPGLVAVGFSLEAEMEEDRAWKKLREKGIDAIFVNPAVEAGVGMEGFQNRGVLLARDGRRQEFPTQEKELLAEAILDQLLAWELWVDVRASR